MQSNRLQNLCFRLTKIAKNSFVKIILKLYPELGENVSLFKKCFKPSNYVSNLNIFPSVDFFLNVFFDGLALNHTGIFVKMVGGFQNTFKIFRHCHNVMYNFHQKKMFAIIIYDCLAYNMDTRCQHYSRSLSNEEPSLIILMKKKCIELKLW